MGATETAAKEKASTILSKDEPRQQEEVQQPIPVKQQEARVDNKYMEENKRLFIEKALNRQSIKIQNEYDMNL